MNMQKTFTRMRNSLLGVIAIIGLSGFSGQPIMSEDAILAEQLSPAATWVDPSASGNQALFVAGHDSNAFYVNQGDGTFIDMAAEVGIERSYIPGTAIYSDAADLNSDGCIDLYVRDFTLELVALNGKGVNHAIYLSDCNGGFTVLPGGQLDAASESVLDRSLSNQSRVTAASVSGDVVVLGTAAADFIRITTTHGDIVVDILRGGMMETVKSFPGGSSRVVMFGGAGDNFVVVDPSEADSAIFEAGPSIAHDLMIDFIKTRKPLPGGVGYNLSNHTPRPVTHGSGCSGVHYYTGSNGSESFIGSCVEDRASMLAGNDSCSGRGGPDNCWGHAGNDYLSAWPAESPSKADLYFGNAGDDLMYNYDASDRMIGGDDWDTGYGCSIGSCDYDIEVQVP